LHRRQRRRDPVRRGNTVRLGLVRCQGGSVAVLTFFFWPPSLSHGPILSSGNPFSIHILPRESHMPRACTTLGATAASHMRGSGAHDTWELADCVEKAVVYECLFMLKLELRYLPTARLTICISATMGVGGIGWRIYLRWLSSGCFSLHTHTGGTPTVRRACSQAHEGCSG